MELIYIIIAMVGSLFLLRLVFQVIGATFNGLWMIIKSIFLGFSFILRWVFRLFSFVFFAMVAVIMLDTFPIPGMSLFLVISLIILLLIAFIWKGKVYHQFYGNLAFFVNLGTIYLAMLQLNSNSISLLVAFLLSINFSTILFYGSDKSIAILNNVFPVLPRVPEAILHWHSYLLGTPSALLSQKIFCHKCSKPSFQSIFRKTLNLQLFLLFSAIFYVLFWA